MFAKKSLGQNFLRCKKVRKLMVEKVREMAVSLPEKPVLIEIGPGRGYLTKSIAKHPEQFSKIILIEKDDALAERLKNKPEFADLEINNQDFLEFDLGKLDKAQYIVIGSLPYNISKHIIHRLITAGNSPIYSIVLLQKEVAEDYAAEAPDMKFLSAYAKLYTRPRVLKIVAPKCFKPPPKVHSAVIEFSKSDPKLSDEIKKSVQRVMKLGFTQPRKTLYNNLKSLYDAEPLKKYILVKFNSEKVRAQELKLEQWIDLAQNLPKNSSN